MARLRRFCPVGYPVHAIQRGNNRADCFYSDHDKATYMCYLHEASTRYAVNVHAWVLMSNHVHLLLTPEEEEGISRLFQFIGRHYVRFFNKKYARTGTLWEGRFKSSLVQEEAYFLTCQRYIELNPVRANLVRHPADYRWSSYHTNAMGLNSKIISPHAVYLALGSNRLARFAAYRALFDDVMPEDVSRSIRFSIDKGVALGSEAFIERIEVESGQRARLMKTGPKGPRKK